MNEPISGALDRLTTEGGRVVVVLRAQLNLMLRVGASPPMDARKPDPDSPAVKDGTSRSRVLSSS